MSNDEIRDNIQAVIDMLKELFTSTVNSGNSSSALTIQGSIDALEIAMKRIDNQQQYLTIVNKIIQHALNDNKDGVKSYAELLASNFEKSDELLKAKMIRNTLKGNKGRIVRGSNVELD